MIKLYDKKIEYGMCDTNASLKPTEIVKILEAAVASFFKLYRKDNPTVKKEYNALWLFTKTKFEVERLPMWDEEVSVEATRVELDSKLLCLIEVYIHPKNQSQGITGWVECVAADITTRRLLRLSKINFEIPIEKEANPSFSKWEEEEMPEVYQLRVTPGYLDYSRHVNNAEYIRILMDSYSLEELENLKIKSMEIHYLNEAHENDLLHIYKFKQANRTDFKIRRDALILMMRLEEEEK